jgi:uncharacterized membrane protein YjjP (DUF1212 family)
MADRGPSSEPAPSTAFTDADVAAPARREPRSGDELAAVIDATLHLGKVIATAGAAGFRVREAMRRAARSFGVTRIEIVFGLDALHATAFAGPLRQTEVVRLPSLGVDMNRICRIDQLSRELASSPGARTPAELHRQLDAIEAEPSPYPVALTPWVLGAACGAFCGAIGGGAGQIVAAFAGAAAGHLLRLYHLRTHPPMATVVVTCAFTSALVSWASARGLAAAAAALDLGVAAAGLGPGKAVLASVLYLIPGVPLVQSLIDVLHFDLGAGLARAAHATAVVVCIAIGVLTFLSLTGFALQ